MANGYGYGRAYGAQALGQGLFNIGNILRRRREEEEYRRSRAPQPPDVSGRITEQRAAGGVPYGEFISREVGAGRQPLTPESEQLMLQTIGRAEQPFEPAQALTFVPPPPEPITTREGKPTGVSYQAPRPYVTSEGMVMAPPPLAEARGKAAAERSVAMLTPAEQDQKLADIRRETTAARPSIEDVYARARAEAAGGEAGAPTQRGPTYPLALTNLERRMDDLQRLMLGIPDPIDRSPQEQAQYDTWSAQYQDLVNQHAQLSSQLLKTPVTQRQAVTQDQADYLRAIGRWDPNKYEVR